MQYENRLRLRSTSRIPLLVAALAGAVLMMTGLLTTVDRAAAAGLDVSEDELEFETLMGFEYEKGKPIPDEIKKYDGKEILLKGYMDTFTQENSREFFLMSASCACDGEVKVNHFVDVRLDDQVVGYRPGLISVRGTFTVKEVEEDGFLVSIFQIEGRIE